MADEKAQTITRLILTEIFRPYESPLELGTVVVFRGQNEDTQTRELG